MHVSTGRNSGRRMRKAERELYAKQKEEKETKAKLLIKAEQELEEMRAENDVADVVRALDVDLQERAEDAYMAGFRDALTLRLERNIHYKGVLREVMAEKAFRIWWASSR